MWQLLVFNSEIKDVVVYSRLNSVNIIYRYCYCIAEIQIKKFVLLYRTFVWKNIYRRSMHLTWGASNKSLADFFYLLHNRGDGASLRNSLKAA